MGILWVFYGYFMDIFWTLIQHITRHRARQNDAQALQFANMACQSDAIAPAPRRAE